ncbi:MAG TPA: hypothetical protein DDZ67_06340, partial [Xanthomonadaceae bacterium]|nr:hypothetical protein [Xanthomonadaceae bacterium]
MKFLSRPADTGLLVALMVAMTATRFHHLGSALHLPDASMAVFFLGGLYLRRYALYALLLALAAAIDYVAIRQQGLDFFQHYCVTPAYGFLLLSYLALWTGGRLCARWKDARAGTLARVLLGGVIAASVSFLISNGAFYWLGGRYPDPHWAQYVERAWQWGPLFVRTTACYIAVALAVQFVLARRRTPRPAP